MAEPERTTGERTLVVIPTYCEAGTLPETVTRLHAVLPGVDVLVVDDDSPDGTGEIADRMAAADDRVHVLHRTGRRGLGAAYVTGFGWALERGYGVIVEMDADGSHRAEDLPRILGALDDPGTRPDVVIGSRWVPGGAVRNWPWHRELLSRAGNTYTRRMLGIRVRDATAGFRAYRARALRALPLHEISSQGYCFQVEMVWRVLQSGGWVAEVPITFVEREHGESKMSRRIVLEALLRVTGWGVRHRTGQVRRLLHRRHR